MEGKKWQKKWREIIHNRSNSFGEGGETLHTRCSEGLAVEIIVVRWRLLLAALPLTPFFYFIFCSHRLCLIREQCSDRAISCTNVPPLSLKTYFFQEPKWKGRGPCELFVASVCPLGKSGKLLFCSDISVCLIVFSLSFCSGFFFSLQPEVHGSPIMFHSRREYKTTSEVAFAPKATTTSFVAWQIKYRFASRKSFHVGPSVATLRRLKSPSVSSDVSLFHRCPYGFDRMFPIIWFRPYVSNRIARPYGTDRMVPTATSTALHLQRRSSQLRADVGSGCMRAYGVGMSTVTFGSCSGWGWALPSLKTC